MGEYIWTNVQFGGKIKASQVDDIRDELLGEDDFDEAIETSMFCSTSGETNYGNAESLCAVLEEFGIDYILTSDAKYEYGGVIVRYDAATKTHEAWNADQGGGATLSLTELRKMMNEGHSMGAAVARLAPSEWTPPPIELIEEPAVTTGA